MRRPSKKAPGGAFLSSGQRSNGSSARGCRSVLLAKLVDAARGVQDLLLAGIERMAVGTDFHLEVVSQSRSRLERVPTGAGHGDFFVFRMRIGFHGSLYPSGLCRRVTRKRARSLAGQLWVLKRKYQAALSTEFVDNSVSSGRSRGRKRFDPRKTVSLVK